MSDWLEGLKAGDKVVVCSGWNDERIATVERLTTTQIVVGNSKYQRRSGRLVGAQGYDRNSLVEATPERVAKIRKKTLAYNLAGFKWHDLSLENLQSLWNQAKAALPATPSDKQP